MRIPGLPGASEPAFRTRDRVWIALDDLIFETCALLEQEGVSLSPYTCKAAIQVGRQLMLVGAGLEGEDLAEEVTRRLRARLVLLSSETSGQALRAYGRVVMGMEITEIRETGS